MILCPIAMAVGCRKCIAFPVCPLKTFIGDQSKESKSPFKAPSTQKASARGRKKPRRR